MNNVLIRYFIPIENTLYTCIYIVNAVPNKINIKLVLFPYVAVMNDDKVLIACLYFYNGN